MINLRLGMMSSISSMVRSGTPAACPSIVIGNEDDQVTPFILQQSFAEALAAAGHKVQLMTHPARPPNHHDLTSSIGITAAARCAVQEE
jgi:acetyl esterase/lipase